MQLVYHGHIFIHQKIIEVVSKVVEKNLSVRNMILPESSPPAHCFVPYKWNPLTNFKRNSPLCQRKLGCLSTPYFGSVMSRNKYQLIWNFLPCFDNTRQEAKRKSETYDSQHKFQLVIHAACKKHCLNDYLYWWAPYWSLVQNWASTVLTEQASPTLCDSCPQLIPINAYM